MTQNTIKPTWHEKDVQELLEMLLAIVDNTSALILVKDLERRLVFFNDKFLAIGDRTKEEILGKTDEELCSPEDAAMFREHDLQVIRSGKAMEFEETACTAFGVRTGLSFKFPLFRPDGTMFAMGAICTDITERKNLEKELRVAKEELERRVQERTEELEKSRQRLRNLAAHLESVREEERTTISREVHDQLGQSLTALKLDLSQLREKALAPRKPAAGDELASSFVEISRRIEQTIQTVRRISSDLRPGILDDFGLEAAVEWEAREFTKRTGIPCSLEVGREGQAPNPEQSTAAFRIFQEILTNVARHAAARNVAASLGIRDGRISMEVRDDGRGITPEEIDNPKSLGLIGMSERALLLSGRLQIEGESGRGTRVSLELPFKRQKEELS